MFHVLEGGLLSVEEEGLLKEPQPFTHALYFIYFEHVEEPIVVLQLRTSPSSF